jgi:hypothetical protein
VRQPPTKRKRRIVQDRIAQLCVGPLSEPPCSFIDATVGLSAAAGKLWPRGGVVTQRSAKPFTPVQFRAWPPLKLNRLEPLSEPAPRRVPSLCEGGLRPWVMAASRLTPQQAEAALATLSDINRPSRRTVPCSFPTRLQRSAAYPAVTSILREVLRETYVALENDPEKWKPIFGKDHAPR